MQIEPSDDSSEGAILRVSRDELLLLVNSIGEAMEALEEWEFPIRVGLEMHAARALLREFNAYFVDHPLE